MKQKLLTLLTLLLCVCGGAWAQTTLFTTDFSDDVWTGITNICNSKNADNETHNGITFHSYNSTAKPFTVNQASGTMTWCNNNMGNNYWIAIPVTNVNGSLTITVANGTTNTRFNYVIKEGNSVDGSPGSGTSTTSAAPSTVTKGDLDKSDYVIYLGRQGSGLTTITSITITTPTLEAPETPVFSPVAGEIETGRTITITSARATTIEYKWGNAVIDGGGDWTGATVYDAEDDATFPVAPAVGATNHILSVRAHNAAGDTYASADYTIVAAKKPVSLSFSPATTSVSLKDKASFVKPTLSATDADGDVDISAWSFSYESDDPTVAVVDEGTGTVTIKAAGTANITANFEGNATYSIASASYELTVTAPPVIYQSVDLTLGHTWDFTSTSDEDWANLGADEINWNEESDTRYGNKTAINGYVVAYYEELMATAGLKASAGAGNKLRINKNSSLGLNGSGITVTLEGLKAGQMITVYAQSGNNDATNRNLNASNVTDKVHFSGSGSGDKWGPDAGWREFSGKVESDGNVVLTSIGGGVNIQKIILTAPTVAVSTASGRNFGTYVTTKDLDFTTVADDIKAFTITGLNAEGTAVVVAEKTEVPAGSPILVKTTTKGATVNVPVAASTPAELGTNCLIAGTGAAVSAGTGSTTRYVLSGDVFKKIGSKEATIPATKAYLEIDGASAPQLSFDFNDDNSEGNTTGIENIESVKGLLDGDFYNLAGQRVAQPTKGLYIVNGRKVIIK